MSLLSPIHLQKSLEPDWAGPLGQPRPPPPTWGQLLIPSGPQALYTCLSSRTFHMALELFAYKPRPSLRLSLAPGRGLAHREAQRGCWLNDWKKIAWGKKVVPGEK